jgi:pilus assembly protein Flp/PilA
MRLQNEAGWAGFKQPGGSQVKNLFKSFVNDESGQDLIEYALLAGFISLVAVTAITSVGTGVNAVYGDVESQVTSIVP